MIYRESLEGGQIRGGMLNSHLEWVRQKHPGWMEPLQQMVPPAASEYLARPIEVEGWYPFKTLIQIDRAIICLRGGGDPATARELGRWSAERNLEDRGGHDLHELFFGAVRLHEKLEDFGCISYQRLGPTACRISMLDCSCYSKLHCWSAEGYFERAAELHGVSAVEVVEERCVCEADVPSCDFVIRWEQPA